MRGTDAYARVILPLAVEGIFTYRIPAELREQVSVGSRVLVSFGKKRIYTAIVHDLDDTPPEGFEAKDIQEVLDSAPMVNHEQLKLWEWISSYYMCKQGELMRAALPSGLRPESESRIRINKNFDREEELDNLEHLLLKVIREEEECTLHDLSFAETSVNPVLIVKNLVEKGAVEVNEFVRKVGGRKQVSYLKFSEAYGSAKEMHALLDSLERAPRQKAIVELMLSLMDSANPVKLLPKTEINREAGDAGAISALVKKGVLEQEEREELKSIATLDPKPEETFDLNPEQEKAREEIQELFGKHQAVLLHGVTSSGKTEIYIRLIEKMLDEKRQVLYMLPEIALTTQIIERIRKVFGNQVGVYHSRYSDSERVHVYRNLQGLTDDEQYKVIIGVRSALFLPFTNLGLIIIDEEHENTYKQQDPAPRYHARDASQLLALYHNARVLMGSATPSFESLYNSRTGKFGYVRLEQRYGGTEAPEIVIANTRLSRKRKQMRSMFTKELRLAIEETIEKGEQVILFQNRRGYSNYIVCNDCGEIPKCKRCDVSLTYHRISGKLECHYCGHKENMPHACPSCASRDMTMKGFGTEKIEDELAQVVEGIRVGRLDTDTARSMKGTKKLFRDFEAGKLDLLVGTQMLSKGLDFSNVSLVGVMDADSMLFFPDFRAFERSFQLISQVSGRAGRRNRQGKVIIQTDDPEHPVIQHILRNDLEGLYQEQMEERQLFGYPPFSRMIRISFRHKIPSFLDGAADLAARELKQIFTTRVLGPQYPPVRKTHNYFIKHIILKIEREASHERARELLNEVLQRISKDAVFKAVRISIDVDPF